jgi:protein-disulfide isomerase
MSDKREREKRRQERLQAESAVDSRERRQRLLQMGAGAVFLVIVAVVALIVVSSTGGGNGGDTKLEGVGAANRFLDGIPQRELTLGDPKAPVELIEFGDLQCPVCKAYAEEVLPPVIEGRVKQGKAKIDFRNFTIIGPDSLPAGAAAVAAGEQGRGWNYIEIFYRNQGEENSGYVDDEFLTAVAKAAGVKDLAAWNKARASARVTGEVKKTTEEAERLGFHGTPSFAIRGPRTNGLELLGTPSSPGDFEAAIDAAG